MTTPTASTWTNSRVVAAGLGAVYLAVGLIGFAVTTGTSFAATHGDKLLGLFMLNPLHNIVHLAVGALLLGASRTTRTAAAVSSLVGAVYLTVGVIGLFVLNSSSNILALNEPDNALHLGSAAVLLMIGLTDLNPARGRRITS